MQTEASLNPAAPEENAAKSLAHYLLTTERLLMGLILVGCGLSGFLNLIPASAMPQAAAELGGTLLKAGFMFPLLKGTEVLLQVYMTATGRKV